MSGVIKESATFFELIRRAAEYAEREGRVAEKKLAKALGVRIPTAAKLVCALEIAGVLGSKDGNTAHIRAAAARKGRSRRAVRSSRRIISRWWRMTKRSNP